MTSTSSPDSPGAPTSLPPGSLPADPRSCCPPPRQSRATTQRAGAAETSGFDFDDNGRAARDGAAAGVAASDPALTHVPTASSAAQLLQWCIGAARAVEQLWQQGQVLLVPEITITAGDGVVLADPGSALPVHADGTVHVAAAAGHAASSGAAGTIGTIGHPLLDPACCAPEIAAALLAAAPGSTLRVEAGRQAVWAAGALVRKLAVASRPRGCVGAAALAAAAGESTSRAHALSQDQLLLARGLPQRVVAVVHRMLQRDPAARPAHPTEALADLTAAATVTLADIEHAFAASRLHCLTDPATGCSVPNHWAWQLRAWAFGLHDQLSHAASLCLVVQCASLWPDLTEDQLVPPASTAWCLAAAAAGSATAQWLAGACLTLRVTAFRRCCSVTLAGRYLRAAAEAGHVEGQRLLGWRLCDAGQAAHAEAEQWLRRAAERGNAEAQHQLGKYCSLHHGWPDAVRWYALAAEQGHAGSQYALGDCCFHGRGLPRDTPRAMQLLLCAAEQGCGEAQLALGKACHSGRAVPRDMDRAEHWLRCSAMRGIPEAACMLGYCYAVGDVGSGQPQYERAVQCWREAGTPLAHHYLGLCYLHGLGVPRDRAHAAHHLRAALLADSPADVEPLYWLAECLSAAEGSEGGDEAEWATMMYDAARKGHPGACLRLADCLQHGHGMERDMRAASVWYERGCRLAQVQGPCPLFGLPPPCRP